MLGFLLASILRRTLLPSMAAQQAWGVVRCTHGQHALVKALKEQPLSQGLLGFELPQLLAPAFSEAGGFGVWLP